MIGDATLAMQLTEQLLQAGVFVQGIRPPTVPPNTARLRVTLTAAHSAEDLQHAVRAFAHVWHESAHATA
jgi:7-keto-8-aminopelargonate synthetase-like enzyme